MRGHVDAKDGSPKMCNVAEKLDRAFFIAILHFPIRRTHAAQRVNSTLSTLGKTRTLAISKAQKRTLPDRLNACGSNVKGLLLRYYADPDLSIRVDRESAHTTPAVINSFIRSHALRTFDLARHLGEILAPTLRCRHVQCDHLFRRQSHGQWALRTVNSRSDLAIHPEFDPQ